MVWGGSGIEKVVFDFIRSKIPNGSTVIELGSGRVSTKALSEVYILYSVEHNPEYANLYENVVYIVTPFTNWYDRDILKEKLPPKELQKLILIDGANRKGILDNMDLFNPDALYIVHDTYRDAEKDLAFKLQEKLNRFAVFHTEGDYWASI